MLNIADPNWDPKATFMDFKDWYLSQGRVNNLQDEVTNEFDIVNFLIDNNKEDGVSELAYDLYRIWKMMGLIEQIKEEHYGFGTYYKKFRWL